VLALRSRRGDEVVLQHRRRSYLCRRQGGDLLIRNDVGEELKVALTSLLAPERSSGSSEDRRQTYVRGLAREAAQAMGLRA
jgi:single-stranded-DNA-specific exonuclease